MRRLLAMLAVVLAAGVASNAWAAPTVREDRSPKDGIAHSIEFDASTDDSAYMEAFGLCSIRFTLGSGDSGTATVYECDDENDATSSCTSETSFTASTATPYTFTPGQRYLKVAASATTLDDSEMTIDCTRNQLSKSEVERFNVTNYGTVSDGVTDDSAAFNAASAAAASAGGGIIYIPEVDSCVGDTTGASSRVFSGLRITSSNTTLDMHPLAKLRPCSSTGNYAVTVCAGSTNSTCDPKQDITTTPTAANPVNIEVTGHGLSTGDMVRVGYSAMPDINDRFFTITRVDDDNFTLDGEDGTSHSVATVKMEQSNLSGGTPAVGDTVDWNATANTGTVVFYEKVTGDIFIEEDTPGTLEASDVVQEDSGSSWSATVSALDTSPGVVAEALHDIVIRGGHILDEDTYGDSGHQNYVIVTGTLGGTGAPARNDSVDWDGTANTGTVVFYNSATGEVGIHEDVSGTLASDDTVQEVGGAGWNIDVSTGALESFTTEESHGIAIKYAKRVRIEGVTAESISDESFDIFQSEDVTLVDSYGINCGREEAGGSCVSISGSKSVKLIGGAYEGGLDSIGGTGSIVTITTNDSDYHSPTDGVSISGGTRIFDHGTGDNLVETGLAINANKAPITNVSVNGATIDLDRDGIEAVTTSGGSYTSESYFSNTSINGGVDIPLTHYAAFHNVDLLCENDTGVCALGVDEVLGGRLEGGSSGTYVMSINQDDARLTNTRFIGGQSCLLITGATGAEVVGNIFECGSGGGLDLAILETSGSDNNYVAGNFVRSWNKGAGTTPFRVGTRASPLTDGSGSGASTVFDQLSNRAAIYLPVSTVPDCENLDDRVVARITDDTSAGACTDAGSDGNLDGGGSADSECRCDPDGNSGSGAWAAAS